MTPYQIQEIIGLHNAAIQAGSFLRKLPKRQVTRITDRSGTSWIVKAYRLAWWERLFHFSRHSLDKTELLRGFTPECVAQHAQGNWQYSITQDAGAVSLFSPRDLLSESSNVLEVFHVAGELLAEIHNANLYHGDTKTPNFVLNVNLSSLPRVVIVDCDRCRKYANGLSPFKRAFNLAQFLASLQGEASLAIAWGNAFLAGYFSVVRLSGGLQRDPLMSMANIILQNHKRIERKYTRQEILSVHWQ